MLFMPPCLLNVLSLAPVHTPVFAEENRFHFFTLFLEMRNSLHLNGNHDEKENKRNKMEN